MYIKRLYYLKKLPFWYRKIVGDHSIPQSLSNEIISQLNSNKFSKKGIKNILIEYQKKQAKKNFLVWNDFLNNSITTERKLTHKTTLPKNGRFSAAIVEARKHPHFEVVVRNFIKNLSNLDTSFYIFHGTDNEKFIKEKLLDIRNIHYINLEVTNLDIEAYNQIILSNTFWNHFNTEKIIIFQTDTYSFKSLDNEFLQFDYIGAPWKKHICKKNKVAVGNGGLSIRSKSMMLKIIEQNISRPNNMPEDVFICQIIKKQKFNLASLNQALNFSTENIFNSEAFGCHKIWEETNTEQLKKILK